MLAWLCGQLRFLKFCRDVSDVTHLVVHFLKYDIIASLSGEWPVKDENVVNISLFALHNSKKMCGDIMINHLSRIIQLNLDVNLAVYIGEWWIQTKTVTQKPRQRDYCHFDKKVIPTQIYFWFLDANKQHSHSSILLNPIKHMKFPI